MWKEKQKCCITFLVLTNILTFKIGPTIVIRRLCDRKKKEKNKERKRDRGEEIGGCALI